MTHTTIAPGIGLSRLWDPNVPVRPGPRPRITLEGITTAAIEIARKHGILRVSMPEIASQLGCSKMALYRHVTDKNDLMSAMLDAAFAAPPIRVSSPFDWRVQVTELWNYLVSTYTRDPWIIDLPSDTNALTPNHLRWLNHSLEVFSHGTLTPSQQLILLQITTDAAQAEALRRTKSPTSSMQLELLASTETAHAVPAESLTQFPLLVAAAADTQARPVSQPHDTVALTMIMDLLSPHFE